MTTKASLLLGLSFTVIACSTGVAGAPPTGTPPPATPPPATPAPPTNPPDEPPNGAIANLDGRQFISISVTDGGVVHALVPNTVIRLTFQAGGSLGASAGCNHIGGTYSIVDGKLVFLGGGMTEMGCDPARHAQDDWLSTFLGSQPTITLNGNDLVLTSGTTVMTLLDREVAEPDRPLVGTPWTLTSIITGEAVSSVPAGVLATMMFNDDGTVEIQYGCNSGGGNYAVDGDHISFSDLIQTEMACLGPGGAVERTVIAILTAEDITFAIDSGSLTLMAGDQGLQFSAINAVDLPL